MMTIVLGANEIRVRHIRQQFLELIDQWDNRAEAPDDGEPMLEIIAASFIADEPTILGAPDFDYITREVAWYDSKSRDVRDIRPPVPAIWSQVADHEHLINSNYGFLVYSKENGEQFANVLGELVRDKDSRRAAMIYTRPSIHVEAGKDFICTNSVQYMIRDDALHVTVQMRSNDAVFGYRNDYAWQNILQTRMWRMLKDTYPNLKLGDIFWQVQSLHIYPRHIPLLRAACRADNWHLPTK